MKKVFTYLLVLTLMFSMIISGGNEVHAESKAVITIDGLLSSINGASPGSVISLGEDILNDNRGNLIIYGGDKNLTLQLNVDQTVKGGTTVTFKNITIYGNNNYGIRVGESTDKVSSKLVLEEGSVITKCKAALKVGWSSTYAAILVSKNGKIVTNNASFEGNPAGAIVGNEGEMELNNTSIIGNGLADSTVWINGGKATFNNTTFRSNTSEDILAISAESKVIIQDCIFENNQGPNTGLSSIIEISSGNVGFKIDNSKIINNKYTGIFIANSSPSDGLNRTIEINDSIINNNDASKGPGGIYWNNDSVAEVILSGSTQIYGNTGTNYNNPNVGNNIDLQLQQLPNLTFKDLTSDANIHMAFGHYLEESNRATHDKPILFNLIGNLPSNVITLEEVENNYLSYTAMNVGRGDKKGKLLIGIPIDVKWEQKDSYTSDGKNQSDSIKAYYMEGTTRKDLPVVITKDNEKVEFNKVGDYQASIPDNYIVSKDNATINLYMESTKYQVIFDEQYDGKIIKKQVVEGDKIETISPTSREGYIFDGWYTSLDYKEKYDFNTNVDKNLIVYAKWIKKDIPLKEDEIGSVEIEDTKQNKESLNESVASIKDSILNDEATGVSEEVATQLKEELAKNPDAYVSAVVNSSEKKMEDLKETEVKEIKKAVEEIKGSGSTSEILKVLDISTYLNVDGTSIGNITKLNAPIQLNIPISEDLITENREFFVMRIHDGEMTILPTTIQNNNIVFETDRFSLYTLVYVEKVSEPVIDIYKVTFVDKDGKVIMTQEVKKGESAKAPDAPKVEGYTFLKWDTSFTNVVSDLTVKAIYEKETPVTPVTPENPPQNQDKPTVNPEKPTSDTPVTSDNTQVYIHMGTLMIGAIMMIYLIINGKKKMD